MRPKYPTEEELKKIAKWPPDENFKGLMDFIRDLWEYADFGYWTQKGEMYSISTGGWSGNEDIIAAMGENWFFWMLCWQQSRRGGHYIFHIKRIKK